MLEWFVNNEDIVKFILIILTLFFPIIIAFFMGRVKISERLEKLVLSGYAVGYMLNVLITVVCVIIYYFYYSEQVLDIWSLLLAFWLYALLIVINGVMAIVFFVKVNKISKR